MEDAALLRRYLDENAQEAFAELVRRHVNLVYGAARRQLGGNEHAAKDVTQAVFTLLAQKAERLRDHPQLGGWLYTATHLTVRDFRRAEYRRQLREQEAHAMHHENQNTPPDWEQLRPVFDDAMQKLNAADRDAILARFFAGRSYAVVSDQLKVSEDAARMRVDRALEKLRRLLERRGITSTTAAIAALCANEATLAAPPGLAAAVTAPALAGATAAGAHGLAAIALHAFPIMTTTKIALAAAGAVAVAATAWTVSEHRETTALRAEVAQLRTEHAALTSLRAENSRLQAEKTTAEQEVARERAELTHIHQVIAAKRAAAQRAAAQSGTPGANGSGNDEHRTNGMIPVELMGNLGRATPSATAQTELWAAQHGDIDTLAGLITFEPAERARLQAFLATLPENIRRQYDTPERLMAFVLSGSPRPITSVQLLKESVPDENTVVHDVRVQLANGETRQDQVVFRRAADGWQHVIGTPTVDRVIEYFQGKK